MKNRALSASILAFAAVFLGIVGDRIATAQSNYYCASGQTVGCNSFACMSLGGRQFCSNGTGYVNAYQVGYTFTPCVTSGTTTCSNIRYNVCWSGGYNPTVTNPCGTLACGTWYTAIGC
jgi:hypothetical protein